MTLTASTESFEHSAMSLPPNLSIGPGTTRQLKAGCEEEVLGFLADRPVHTAMMAGFIRDNGLVSPLNRGSFYAHRDEDGRLEGVALIGHIILIDARTERAISALARVACGQPHVSKIAGEQEVVVRFWDYYRDTKHVTHYRQRDLLFERRWSQRPYKTVCGLRLATPEDLPLVMTAHVRMAEEILGINLLAADAEGFRLRCARRIEQGRVWVWVRDGQLIFKAEVIANTPEAIYIEGVYVEPEERGKGIGTACLMQVSSELMTQTQAICLLASEDNPVAQRLFRSAGYTVTSCYETVFLNR
jgi:uncharacterized protein